MKTGISQESNAEVDIFEKAKKEAEARSEWWQNFCEADPDGARDIYNAGGQTNE